MRELIQKKSVQVLLGLLLMLVWGYNMISFFNLTTEEEVIKNPETLSDLNLGEVNAPVSKNYQYSADFRDPFRPGLTGVRQSPPPLENKSEPEELPLPVLQLTGIVENTAIIKDQLQKPFFVSKGDTVQGARVKSVTRDSVILVYRSKEIILTFN